MILVSLPTHDCQTPVERSCDKVRCRFAIHGGRQLASLDGAIEQSIDPFASRALERPYGCFQRWRAPDLCVEVRDDPPDQWMSEHPAKPEEQCLQISFK